MDISCSDLKGYDGAIHAGDAREMIISAREWLASLAGRRLLYLPEQLIPEFEEFEARLPDICSFLMRPVSRIAYPDLCWLMEEFFIEKDTPLSLGALRFFRIRYLKSRTLSWSSDWLKL